MQVELEGDAQGNKTYPAKDDDDEDKCIGKEMLYSYGCLQHAYILHSY